MVFRLFCTVIGILVSSSCLAQGAEWHPRATLSCDTYVSEAKLHKFFAGNKASTEGLLKRDDQFLSLLLQISALQDRTYNELAEFTNRADLKPTQTSSLRTTAIGLLLYCPKFPNKLLRDIDPMDVVRHPLGDIETQAQLIDAAAWYRAAITTCSDNSQCSTIANSYRQHASDCILNSTKSACDAVPKDTSDWTQMKSGSNQITTSDPALNKWVADSLTWCGTNAACKNIVKSYQAHTIACSQGSQQACADHDRDLRDWDAMNASGGGVQASGDARMQCLQLALNQTMAYCKENNCPSGEMPEIARLTQQAKCGYSAIEPSTSYVPPAPQFPTMSDCSYTPRVGGGFNSTCTQY